MTRRRRPGFPCPNINCGKSEGTLTEPRAFNLMFETNVGAVVDESNKAYLRPETAQGIFVNFKNVCDTGRVKVPFGIAQVGKSFRNEINPRNFTFRSREFEQMEIEFFCHPDDAAKWYKYWRDTRFQWYVGLGLRSDRLRLRDHDPDELAFYSTATADIEYSFPFGVSELEGIAHRGEYDLSQHQKFSGKDLSYFDEERWERDKAKLGMNSFKEYLKSRAGLEDAGLPYQYLPHVIEPSAGADRATLAFLCEAYTEDEVGGEARTVLKFHPRLAPIKAAVFPLVKKDGMPEKAEALYRALKRHFPVFYDEKGAIGRRYRRQDEAGTPFCITVDGQTLTDGTITFRDRDSCRQWRVASSGVVSALRDLLEGQPIPPRADLSRSSLRTVEPRRGPPSEYETLHQPGDHTEHDFRGRPRRVFAGWLVGGRALADEAGDLPRVAHDRRGTTIAQRRRARARRGVVSGRAIALARGRASGALGSLSPPADPAPGVAGAAPDIGSRFCP